MDVINLYLDMVISSLCYSFKFNSNKRYHFKNVPPFFIYMRMGN